LLFDSISRELSVGLDALVMVGDDAEFDVAGALAAGCGAAVLVRTGKHRPGDESKFAPRPTLVIDSVVDLPRVLAERDAAGWS
jgi:ribonucleotide monophosphatase NagD (HAD superfamily)